jgi:hypothetical protein
MSAALWLTDRRQTFAALLCGTATLLACVVPALPFLWLSGLAAWLCTTALCLGSGAIICWLRPDKGARAIAETYGVLLAAGAVCYAVSFLF